ncbi:MAG: fibro-slime domain-containing protein, partial [Oscillospiraceae bacterium]|nr:fibro-slime domain-containing protein [Oscillospiraceae bacterium]
EGTRRPDEAVEDYLAEQAWKAGEDAADAAEYISAVVRVENVYDVDGLYGEKDAYLGQDLIFTFAPYSIEKNQHEYDSTGKPTKAGEEIKGWFTFDLNMGQVDFEEPEITTSTAEETSNIEDNVDGDSESSPGEDESNEENHSVNNTTVDVNTADDESSEDGKADDNQDHAVTIERAERTAEIIFVEEEWDEKDKKIDQISTTLKAVEETVLEAQNDDNLEDDEDPSVSSEKERLAEENEGALSDDTTADGNVKDPADTEQAIMPAMSFNDSIKVSTGKPAGIDQNTGSFLANAAESLPEEAEVSVRVEADEGTFPAGTTMVLSAVDQSSYDALAETLTETVENGDASDAATSDTDTSEAKANGQQAETDNAEDHETNQNTEQNNANNNTNIKTYGFQAVDITFFDKDGNEIEPAKPVRVALTSKVVEQAREKAEESAIADPVVVHVDNEGKAEQMDLVSPEEVEPAKGRSEEELLEEAEKTAESGKTDNADNDISADDSTVKKDVEYEDDENHSVNNESADESTEDASGTSVDNKDSASDGMSNADADKNKADAVDEAAAALIKYTDAAEESATAADKAQADITAEEDGERANTAEFTADSFSVYAIVYTVELYTNVITDSGETYRISVTYDETSGIPQDAELKVKEIKEGDKGYENYYTEAVKAASESSDAQNDASDKDNKRVNPDKTYARFFDIEIWANGEKVEPVGDVSVSIRLLDVPETDDKSVTKIVHFAQDDIEVIPHTTAADHVESVDTAKDQDDEQAENNVHSEMEFNFTASSFSVYSVVSYTVDFYWEVDGKLYKFSLPGGGFVSLQQLVEVLGIARTPDLNEKVDGHEVNSDTEEIENSGNESSIDGSATEDKPLTLENVIVSDETQRFVANVETVEFSDPNLVWVGKVNQTATVGVLKEVNALEIQHSKELTEEQIEEINAIEVQEGDWALISLKSFDTDEWLTVTLKDNKIYRIHVIDPVEEKAPNQMQVLATQDTYAKGVKMWLFDYDDDQSLDNSNNKANTSNNKTDGINSRSDLKFLGWGAGNDKKAYDSYGNDGFGINDFTGLDEGNYVNRIRALQGIVKNELVDGYPVLNDNHKKDGVNQSLDYLFNPDIDINDRTVYGGTDGEVTSLFELNNQGYYIFDSDEHYAQLDKTGGKNVTVFTSTLAQTNKDGSQHTPKARAVGFFPFDTYEHTYNTKYGNNYNYGTYGYGSLYLNPDGGRNSNERVGLNHHLGVAMEMNFVIPAGGKIENTPIQFKFSGDDDMWVFIDDQLVLDIGGLHQPVDGTIDFSTGKATIIGKTTTNRSYDNTGPDAIATVEDTKNYTRGNDFNFYNAINTLASGDGKVHTMKVFYLERGGCDSNACSC